MTNMNHIKVLNAVRAVSISLLIIGMMMITLGFLGNNNSTMTAIGIGTISGAVVIFLMGIFFVATDEMLGKLGRG
jgi:TRAP-type C4-dicarboxylate transport system permease small subunit